MNTNISNCLETSKGPNKNIKKKNSGLDISGATVDDNTCVVCFKNVEIYSIGDCDHPVCYECSTRMRVLCQQNECPICRQALNKVIFTYEKLPYRDLEVKNRSEHYNKKYKIGFYTPEIQRRFFELLDHPCPKCNEPSYRTFQGLRNHVRRVHDLHYCDLCVDNLKIFTFERRCYTSGEMALHRTKGDIDNRSHRGHPLCEYCNKRFLDRDELFRHLRREHYFCHFCDADGCNEFYRDYTDLAEHFRQRHFLCEEGNCASVEFTGAFRTEIDYKAHVANVHGKMMNKQQAKQTRTLQLEITLGGRGRSSRPVQRDQDFQPGGNNNEIERNIQETMHMNTQESQLSSPNINPNSEQEFPSLNGIPSCPSISLTRSAPLFAYNHSRSDTLARTKENFPALCSNFNDGFNSTRIWRSEQTPTISTLLKKQSTAVTGATPRITTSNQNQKTSKSSNSIVSNNINVKKTLSNVSDFPALSMAKSKKSTNKLNTDSIVSDLQLLGISPKHQKLVNDYVSVTNAASCHKLQFIEREESVKKATKEVENDNSAPKLTSQDFPSLSGKTDLMNAMPTATWVKPPNVVRSQREIDNRKNKIASAPILPKSSSNMTKSCISIQAINLNNYNNQIDNNDKKKEKKVIKSNDNNSNKSKKNHHTNTNIFVNETKRKHGAQCIKGNLQNESTINNNNDNVSTSHKGRSSAMIATLTADRVTGARKKISSCEVDNDVQIHSFAKEAKNLKFSNSLDEVYNALPTYSFTPPPEALRRNQNLVFYFRDVLESMEALEEFRLISQRFREGLYKTQPYYEHCRAALKGSFNEIFPELLVLLPDIAKQQELYLVHQQYLQNLSPIERKAHIQLEVCSTCKQILIEEDLDVHYKMHEFSTNFPQLNSNQRKFSFSAKTC